MPKEQFQQDEAPKLKPAPGERYDIPTWTEPRVARDQLAPVSGALYSLPTQYVGQNLRARADSSTVRFYAREIVVKVHARQPLGGKSIDPNDLPDEKRAYAMRDAEFLKQQADSHGKAIGAFAVALLDGPLPWTRLRQVYALLGLVRRYNAERVEAACEIALSASMHDVRRLTRMVEQNVQPEPKRLARVIPIGRYLRPANSPPIVAPTSGSPHLLTRYVPKRPSTDSQATLTTWSSKASPTGVARNLPKKASAKLALRTKTKSY